MHPFRLCSICSLLTFLVQTIFAQQPAPALRFAKGNFYTGANIAQKTFRKQSIQSALFEHRYFVVVQFNQLPDSATKQGLQMAGMYLGDYIPQNAFLATVEQNFAFENAADFGIISINVQPQNFKIATRLLSAAAHSNKDEVMVVTYYKAISKSSVQSALQQLGAIIVPSALTGEGMFFIEVNPKLISAIAALPFVSSLSLQPIGPTLLNLNTITTNGAAGLQSALYDRNLNGQGVTIGIGDVGTINTHIDLSGRVLVRTPVQPENHATHVSGTTAGAGNLDERQRGMAPKATLIDQYFTGILENAPTYLFDNNMVLTNNSYYVSYQNCPGNGEYNALSSFIDQQMNENKQLLHVFAAGNDGQLSCEYYPSFFGTVKSGYQCAKNVLTVGAINAQSDTYGIAPFSSRGPTAFGRIKPEITANGYSVTSTQVNNSYGQLSGTSMAAPATTGALALLCERFRQLHGGANPSAALMKNLVCNTAIDLGNAGPDYTYGFGMLNIRTAVEALEANQYLEGKLTNRQQTKWSITVPANTKRVKIMLNWTDPQGPIYSSQALINDLDLTVKDASGLVHLPMVLNVAIGHLTDVAAEGVDHLNNMEQVVIENPAPGNYEVNLSGFSIPYLAQDFAVSYALIEPAVKLMYPIGGEKWVPNEVESIRWTAEGNEDNSFALDYSIDDGATWSVINHQISNLSKNYNWQVPSAITTSAKIRISRNNTLLGDVSAHGFTVLPQPTIAINKLCEGSVQINWDGINDAASFDVFQLVADTMQQIGNTTSNSFNVLGLNKNGTNWFAVAARSGNFIGRRSIAVSVVADGGPCTNAIFNQDVKVDSILSPNTARQYFSNEADALAPVKVLIKNGGAVNIAGPLKVSFTQGTDTVTENVTANLLAGGTYTHTFSGKYPIAAAGFKYHFKAWVTSVADANHLNDTAYKTVKYINNAPITSLPIKENFESFGEAIFSQEEMAIGENKYLDYSATSSRGRVRTFINTGFSRSGKKSLIVDRYPYIANDITANSVVLNYNLSAQANRQLRFDFYYKKYGQLARAGNKVWIRGSDQGAWLPAFDLFSQQGLDNGWGHGIININQVLNNALPAQTITASFQIKLGEEGNASINNLNASGNKDEGYIFDDLSLTAAASDLSLQQINSSLKMGCGLSANTPISVQVVNTNLEPAYNAKVSYQINGAAVVTEIIPQINPSQTLDYTFRQTADLSSIQAYRLNTWIAADGDADTKNDSILNYTFHHSPLINTFPYFQSFETDAGGFYTEGPDSSWQWGKPNKTIINKAANGSKAWVTHLSKNYNNNENTYLYTPCFDLSSMIEPMLSFSHIIDLKEDNDFSWMEYSVDGINWQNLGIGNTRKNWYEGATNDRWKISNKKWHVASTPMANLSAVKFRFLLNSNAQGVAEGIGIDDFTVEQKFTVADYIDGLSVVMNKISGNEWQPFYKMLYPAEVDFVFGAINPYGQNLGRVTLDFYPRCNEPKTDDGQAYYLNRSFVIHSENPPTDSVGLRLYFTDRDVEALLARNDCLPCSKPRDAYELGVTKYSGSFLEENNKWSDNISGFFQSILPGKVVITPHNNGYSAEFKVSGFSEFWFNSGGHATAPPLAVKYVFEASKAAGKALLYWKTTEEINTARYIIERSADGRVFTKMDSLTSKVQPGGAAYDIIDAQPLAGNNYYRLKIVDRSGKPTYSEARRLDFSKDGQDFLIYPNPVKTGVVMILSSINCSAAVLFDQAGKAVRHFVLAGTSNKISTTGLSKGIYHLKIISINTAHVEKIVID